MDDVKYGIDRKTSSANKFADMYLQSNRMNTNKPEDSEEQRARSISELKSFEPINPNSSPSRNATVTDRFRRCRGTMDNAHSKEVIKTELEDTDEEAPTERG